MQQFVVPQFIDVEDKIIGPITVRQFIVMLVGGGFIFVAYKLADFTLFIVEMIAISSITFGVAFIKINGRPIHYFLLNVLQTSKRPKIRIWQKMFKKSELSGDKNQTPISLVPKPVMPNKVRASRLAEMALIVDTGGVYQGEKEPPDSNNQLL
ncbi:MAG: PrgI family protein [Patescibacteria group bacterium]|jgi:hypothetical protein|nr:PrgI family protein [Patescibacteria group bacterium]